MKRHLYFRTRGVTSHCNAFNSFTATSRCSRSSSFSRRDIVTSSNEEFVNDEVEDPKSDIPRPAKKTKSSKRKRQSSLKAASELGEAAETPEDVALHMLQAMAILEKLALEKEKAILAQKVAEKDKAEAEARRYALELEILRLRGLEAGESQKEHNFAAAALVNNASTSDARTVDVILNILAVWS